MAKRLSLEQFELSQSYLAFWDKFERCNYFFEAVLETAELPLTDRTVSYILSDGGVSDFEYVDKDGAYHRDSALTSISFRDKYFGGFIDGCVSLINASTDDKPYDKLYTVKYLGNVAEDKRGRHLNLPMEELKAAVLRQLQAGEIVWLGSDCGKYGDWEAGVWDDQTFRVELIVLQPWDPIGSLRTEGRAPSLSVPRPAQSWLDRWL